MIPVKMEEEPSYFDERVRTPGSNFLASEVGERQEKPLPDYWNRAKRDVSRSYRKICAYTCQHVAGLGEIDHFLPKSKSEYRPLAYEWSNYRLASSEANKSKGNREGILDPFEIEHGWFELGFPDCLVKPSGCLPSAQRSKVVETIRTLNLNDDERYVDYRAKIVKEFAGYRITMNYLARHYPFIAYEINRQGEDYVRKRMKRRANSPKSQL